MTGAYLSNIELGKVPPPMEDIVIAIADKLNHLAKHSPAPPNYNKLYSSFYRTTTLRQGKEAQSFAWCTDN